MRAAAWYFLYARNARGLPADPVARFHLGNGARLEQMHFLADLSENGIRQSHGMMVNYLYDLDDIEKNHEAFAENRMVVASSAVRKLARPGPTGESCRSPIKPDPKKLPETRHEPVRVDPPPHRRSRQAPS